MKTNRFVKHLTDFSGEAVFNPYTDVCPIYDRSDAPKIRRANLRQMINAALDERATTLWVARDLGYRGGRRTGLALTDEAHLDQLGILMAKPGFRRATKGPAVAERTASVIWETLMRIGEPIMLWNIFPFHPHEAHDPMSNRSHSKAERDYAMPLLHELIDILAPKRVVAIGRDAALALDDIDVPTFHARHPSYGGQTLFVEQIEELYGLNSSTRISKVQELPLVV